MAEEFIIRLVNSDNAETTGSASGGGGGGVSPLKAGAAMGAGFAVIAELAGIVKDAIANVLKPIKVLVTGIIKVLAEFLRPIVDILVIALRPILSIVKPFLQLFRSFMAPFIGIAREMANIADAQIRGGNTSAGIKTSIEAINLLVTPFVVSITSIALQLATTLLIAGITNILDGMLGALQSAFALLPEWIGGRAVDGLQTARDALESGSDALIKTINSKVTDATTFILDGIEADAKEQLEDARARLGKTVADTVVEPTQGAFEDAATKIGEGADDLAKNTEAATTTMDVVVTDKLGPGGSVTTTFSSGLATMESAVDAFGSKLQSAADAINSINIKSRFKDDDDDDKNVYIGEWQSPVSIRSRRRRYG